MANHNVRSDLQEIVQFWHENHCLRKSSITQYLRWVRRFKTYCQEQGLSEVSQLTLSGVGQFSKWYAQSRRIDNDNAFDGARSALQTWALALKALGHVVPRWQMPATPQQRSSPLLRAFASYLREHRGNPAVTINKKIGHIDGFLAFLLVRKRRPQRVRLFDIDAYITLCSKRYARTTVADICCSIRSFLRFLHATGRIPADLASSVMAPIVRRGERPLRALPWDDVRRILHAVDRSTPGGQRDYALLLMMSTYGLGAGEVIRIKLEDIDWKSATLRVVRPKTSVEILLPLLPAVARVLVTYLRRGRPAHAATRHLFVTMNVPHVRLSGSSSVRHILIKHARSAGVTGPYLGSHALRHSHACQQMEQGASPKVIGDILGHRRPESTSAYIRISTERLRQIALPVPV
jgi:site-specific recombinase XerD